MKYLVIGTGGVGGCIGGFLAKAGEDVTFIARGRHLNAMKENGLKIISEKIDNFVVESVCACTMEDYNNNPDVIFVCVKYYSISETIGFINKIVKSDTVVIPVLNVYGTGERMQERLPETTVLDGCVYILAQIKEPGVIYQGIADFKVVFGYRKNQIKTNEEEVASVCNSLINAGINYIYTDNIEKEALVKFSLVSPMGTTGLYFDSTSEAILAEGEIRNTFIELVTEIIKLGNAMGVSMEDSLLDTNIKIVENIPTGSTTSMQRDVISGGESEIEGLVIEVVRLAQKYNVNVPAYSRVAEWAVEKGLYKGNI